MKFSCDQQTLSKALNIVSKGVTLRTTIPILKGILLSVKEDGVLTMSASDLDLTVEKKVNVFNYEAGEIVVPAKMFTDIIKKLPNCNIDFYVNEGSITIKCMSSNFEIVTMQPEEFPKISVSEDGEELIVQCDKFKDMIKETVFAASLDDSKGPITGVLLSVENNILNMVSLDGFRMAISRKSIDSQDKEIIIPAKLLSEVGKIISESEQLDENIKIILSEKRAIFKIVDVTVIIRLLDGNFIKYKDILPKESKITIKVNKSDFLNSVERASLFAKIGKNNLIKIDINDNNLNITSNSEEGNVEENIQIIKTGEDLTIGFNSKYIIDALKVIDDEEITMLFNTSVSPCLIKPVEGSDYEYLILPVRITNN